MYAFSLAFKTLFQNQALIIIFFKHIKEEENLLSLSINDDGVFKASPACARVCKKTLYKFCRLLSVQHTHQTGGLYARLTG